MWSPTTCRGCATCGNTSARTCRGRDGGRRSPAATSTRNSSRRCSKPRSTPSTPTTGGTFDSWREAGIVTPPVMIVVCNNTATSKLLYDYIAGGERTRNDGTPVFKNGRLESFRNYGEDGSRLARPRTLLIDSEQIESGDVLDKAFREAAKDQIERFRREIVDRTRQPGEGGGDHRRRFAARSGEHGRKARNARRRHPLRGLRPDAHRRLGRQHRNAHPRHPGLRDPNSSANRSSGGRCAGSRTS